MIKDAQSLLHDWEESRAIIRELGYEDGYNIFFKPWKKDLSHRILVYCDKIVCLIVDNTRERIVDLYVHEVKDDEDDGQHSGPTADDDINDDGEGDNKNGEEEDGEENYAQPNPSTDSNDQPTYWEQGMIRWQMNVIIVVWILKRTLQHG